MGCFTYNQVTQLASTCKNKMVPPPDKTVLKGDVEAGGGPGGALRRARRSALVDKLSEITSFQLRAEILNLRLIN